jgi:exosortase
MWIVLGLGALGTVGSLVRFWGIQTEYADRFLVLLGAAWAAYQLWPRVAAAPLGPRPLLALPLIVAGGAVVPFGWFLQVQTTGGRAAILWFQGGGLLVLTAGAILARYGAGRLRVLAFPLMFCTFALPIPSILAAPMQTFLQHATTSLAERALPLIGIPVIQRDGFVLRLAGGDLGVAAACSGVRSMTALTALAAFIAYLRGLGLLRGILLEAATVVIVAIVNGVRVVASGLIQEWFGDQYIRGEWHEALGLAMVFLGLGIIVQVSKLLGKPPELPPPGEPQPAGAPGLGGGLAAAAVLVTAAVTAFAIQAGMAANSKFVAKAPFENIPMTLGEGPTGWRGINREVPDYVTEMLGQDQALFREYENNTGQRVYVWALFWSTADMVKGYHHPDVCWGNKGYASTAKRIETIHPSAGGAIPATVREFQRDILNGKAREYQYVLYWTQEGSRVWDDRDEHNALSGGFGFFFDPKMWFREESRDEAVASNGRLVVLVCSPGTDPASTRDALKFTRLFCDELYRICPWAGPPHPPIR